MTTAYAYTRVSTTKQDIDGKTGLSRQLDTIKEFLVQHPDYTLSQNIYSDRASGFHGMNIKDDAGLGSFLNDCENGIVKAGDMLCVELVDRLSRLPPNNARELFKRILSYGVKVAIVRWAIVIDNDKNKIDLAGDLLLTVGFHLAHMESEQKSKRILAAKQKNVGEARKGNKILFSGRSVPRWLELNKDKTKFNIKPYDAELINRMFDMKISGLGANKILTTLKAENSLMLGGKALTTDSITKLLKNRRLIGEWQPQNRNTIEGQRVNTNNGDPIVDYFPQAVSEELFNAAQASFKHVAKGKAARRFNNVFNGLLKCSDCGYAFTHKITYSKGKPYRIYYSCTGNTHNKVCDRKSIHMNPVRDKLLQVLSILDYSKLQQDEHATRTMALQRGALEHKIQQTEKALKNLTRAISQADNDSDVDDLMTTRKNSVAELSEANRELSQLNNAANGGQAGELREGSQIDLESEDERIKLNHLLRQHIEKIVVYENKWCSISFNVGYMEVKRVIVSTEQESKPFVQFVTKEDEIELAKEYSESTEENLIKAMIDTKQLGKELLKASKVINLNSYPPKVPL